MLLFLFFLTFSQTTIPCCFKNKQKEEHLIPFSIQGISSQDGQIASPAQIKQILMDTLELHDEQKRARKSFCRRWCCENPKKTLIQGVVVTAVALPLIYQLVPVVHTVRNDITRLENGCATMQSHCQDLDEKCSGLTDQAQLLIQLLANMTKMSPGQINCMSKCHTQFGNVIDIVACVANCVKNN